MRYNTDMKTPLHSWQSFVRGRACFILALASINAFASDPGGINPDQPIGNFDAHAGFELHQLCRSARVSCGIEEDAVDRINPSTMNLSISSASIRSVLRGITARYGHYTWTTYGNVINVRPTRRSGEDYLSRTLVHFRSHGLSSLTTMQKILKAAHIQCGIVFAGDPRYRRVDVDLTHVTVREALNAVAQQDGGVIWSFRPSSANKLAAFSLSSWKTDGMSLNDILLKEQAGIVIQQK